MPISDQAFWEGLDEERQTLQLVTETGLAPNCSVLAAAVLSNHVLEATTEHLRKSKSTNEACDKDFWLRHQQVDNLISRALLRTPDHLRSDETKEPLAVHMNMCLQTFSISLYQAAEKAALASPDSNTDLANRLRARCRRCAVEIVDIMKAARCMSIRKVRFSESRVQIC